MPEPDDHDAPDPRDRGAPEPDDRGAPEPDDRGAPEPDLRTWWARTLDAVAQVRARPYALTRWVILRLLGVVYVFAFLGILWQQHPLLGSHGLTPIAQFTDAVQTSGQGFWDLPSLFMLDSSDATMSALAVAGLVLAIAMALGYANLPSVLALWVIYGSYERVGQMWFGFGWEIQILETTLLAACLVHPWDPRPLRAPAPSALAIGLMRWLVFRIFLGAGLIKLRGSTCWTDLTCLDAHFETQPLPNPLSVWFHFLPHGVHAVGVVVNHVVELALPWCVFGPRRLRLVAAYAMLAFQVTLIASGNLAFLNWLTVVPVLALFDDDALLWWAPRRLAAWVRARAAMATTVGAAARRLAWADTGAAVLTGVVAAIAGSLWLPLGVVVAGAASAVLVVVRRAPRWPFAVAVFAGVVGVRSCLVVANLASSHQRMNGAFDRFASVNTYGAFGSVDFERHELVIEGTRDADPAKARWSPYELPCKPGDVARRPCVLGPYHLRFDWLIWFAAMSPEPDDGSAWMLHVVWKLLDGDRGVRELFATDPFSGARPTFVRVRRFAYHLAPYDADVWWTRDEETEWLPPLSLDSENFAETLARFGWPSPTLEEHAAPALPTRLQHRR